MMIECICFLIDDCRADGLAAVSPAVAADKKPIDIPGR
jgi:hypothetical protein